MGIKPKKMGVKHQYGWQNDLESERLIKIPFPLKKIALREAKIPFTLAGEAPICH
jgi:hypothetical protein